MAARTSIPPGNHAMPAFIVHLGRLIDSVLGLPAAAARDRPACKVPCNIFSGYMIFGCRQAR
jgi:hypothetical protein